MFIPIYIYIDISIYKVYIIYILRAINRLRADWDHPSRSDLHVARIFAAPIPSMTSPGEKKRLDMEKDGLV